RSTSSSSFAHHPCSIRAYLYRDTSGSSGLLPLSLHDALPISRPVDRPARSASPCRGGAPSLPDVASRRPVPRVRPAVVTPHPGRSEEHTSELQSRFDLVCRLLLEKKTTA